MLVSAEDHIDARPQQWQNNNTPPPPPANHIVSIHLIPSPLTLPSSLMSSNSSCSGSNQPISVNSQPSPSPGISLGLSKSAFTYKELVIATDGFSNTNLLGQGGFGCVHRGVLPNRKEITVKHLKIGNGQGECEFQAEVEIISRVHHKHLVSLVGYYITGAQRMLVYEFVPNNTLEFHLHGKGRPTMGWTGKMKIYLGSAKSFVVSFGLDQLQIRDPITFVNSWLEPS